ncbi:MAG TPA: phosphoglycolate phosphatase, partial [Steroidobacteraceae bacterium]|nr:phosphoglycolate phosphatase [Steroidobacteraceae bacterium]
MSAGRPIRAVLLDLDGTLLDTAPDMANALNLLRRERGVPVLSYEAIRPHVSHGAAAMIRLGFPDAPDDEVVDLRGRFLELYREHLAGGTRLFDGFESVLATLEGRGVPWGIVTNKPAFLTEPLLAALGLEKRAACVVSGDTVAQRKPHPAPMLHAAKLIAHEPAHCLYVGDAQRDVQAARAAGMRVVVALFGYLGGTR